MSTASTQRFTLEQYLARERTANFKSEFYRGEIFAMTGGSPRHNTIGGNIFAGLRVRLRGSSCRPFNSDQRICIPANGLATYPDTSVVCGDYQTDPKDPDAIINPRILFEVLSESTESYDRGRKFDLYRQLDSLQEYVLVSQDEPQVDHFVRREDGTWLLTVLKGIDGALAFKTVDCTLPFSEIYEDVQFGPEKSST